MTASSRFTKLEHRYHLLFYNTEFTMAKSKNHTNHNQNKKAHKNKIKRAVTSRHPNQKGVDAKFRRNQKYAVQGSLRAVREARKAAAGTA
ncbi:50S small subunit ribosomal protein L29 [Tremella mesenterica]|uniref:60S ribosomal protein L29 n=1 Tax=Tremella mesenterica TaxID=5217 RepID=A0A4Q1BEB7_TREME|nr:50S small subunit ribosomal protein L29 [Tremella mesenterica]